MKQFKRIGKKSISLLLTLLMVISTMLVGIVSVSATITGYSAFYFKPGNWDVSNAEETFALGVNYIDPNNYKTLSNYTEIIQMTYDETSGYYKATLSESASYNTLNILRMNQDATEIWNYTNPFHTIDSGYNCYEKKSNDNNWDGWNVTSDNGTWSTYSEGGTTPETVTFYFKNTNNWSDVKCYAWNTTSSGNVEISEKWSGNTMTLVDSAQGIYSVTFQSEPEYVIFNGTVENNATKQTVDLKTADRVGNMFECNATAETSDPNNGKYSGYWTTYAPAEEPDTYTITDKSNADAVTVTAKADGCAANTANAGSVVTVTATAKNSWYTVKALTASYVNTANKETDITVSGSNGIYTFTMPNDIAEGEGVEVTASYTLDKAKYIAAQGDGLWVDVAPDRSSISTLIKWNNYYGAEHTTSNPYTFYLPKGAALTGATVYNGYGSEVTLNGTSIPADGSAAVNLTISEIQATGGYNGTVKVMQGSTDAMFLYTTDGNGNDYDLPTKIGIVDRTNKDATKAKGGDCVTIDDGTVSSPKLLEQVKGRGNSSWKASADKFGKYAFNMKLAKKEHLFGLNSKESPNEGAKSYCLLANNADESMLRNTLTYDLANELGLPYAPEYEFVDIYDNGEYMGQYLVTEKVDVGENKLVTGTAFDDLNEDIVTKASQEGTYTYGGQEYSMKYDPCNGNQGQTTGGTYLLEFEVSNVDDNIVRYDQEASGFISPQGQHVVVKSPEYATKEQVEYIAAEYAKMEAIAFSDDISQLGSYMDTESFALMYLIQELSSNLDSAATSYYIMYNAGDAANTKAANNKFVASPVWDYDWAWGQYEKDSKYIVQELKDEYNALYDTNVAVLDSDDPQKWFARYRAYDAAESSDASKYSLQSKLANNTDFQKEIKKAWQTNFYTTVQDYYKDGGKLDTWRDKISASVEMNETRWDFIKDDLLSGEYGWGSKDTADTFDGAVDYLKNTWTQTRVTWLNTEINKFTDFTLATPTVTCDTPTVSQGTNVVLKVTTTDSFVTNFKVYDNNNEVTGTAYDSAAGTITIPNPTVGTHSYTVKAVYNGKESAASTPVSVKVEAVTETLEVSLSANPTSVTVGGTVTLTATVTSGTASTYTFYQDSRVIAENATSSTCSVTLNEAGNYTFYVVAKDADGNTAQSSTVTVNVTADVETTANLRIYFKSASASVYVPTLTFDGTTYTMTRDKKTSTYNGTFFGTNYSGSLSFYWYYADIDNVSTSTAYSIRITTPQNRVNASLNYTFNTEEADASGKSNYYFAVDNLMGDTELVNLPGSEKNEYIRNYHISATHMIHSSTADNNVGFTWINGAEYYMGATLEEAAPISSADTASAALTKAINEVSAAAMSVSGPVGNFSVKSATLVQKVSAEANEVSDLQYMLLDVNLDGEVDVRDATMIQKALVGA